MSTELLKEAECLNNNIVKIFKTYNFEDKSSVLSNKNSVYSLIKNEIQENKKNILDYFNLLSKSIDKNNRTLKILLDTFVIKNNESETLEKSEKLLESLSKEIYNFSESIDNIESDFLKLSDDKINPTEYKELLLNNYITSQNQFTVIININIELLEKNKKITAEIETINLRKKYDNLEYKKNIKGFLAKVLSSKNNSKIQTPKNK